jgi:hypothetical protein
MPDMPTHPEGVPLQFLVVDRHHERIGSVVGRRSPVALRYSS